MSLQGPDTVWALEHFDKVLAMAKERVRVEAESWARLGQSIAAPPMPVGRNRHERRADAARIRRAK